jgi:hypothetical protein
VGKEFPLECPGCGGDIRLMAFITEPGPIRKILTHLGEPLEPPPVSPARGPPADGGELVQAHDDRAIFQPSPDELPDIHSLCRHSMPRCGRPASRAVSRPVCAKEKNSALSTDRKLTGNSTIRPHTARPTAVVAPRDPPRSAVVCRSAIGRPILELSHLLMFPSVLITSHQAFLTCEALSEIARVTTLNILNHDTRTPFLEGTTL